MLSISHSTRAYVVNAEGLYGFVIADIMKHLKAADKAGQLEHVKKQQVINLDLV